MDNFTTSPRDASDKSTAQIKALLKGKLADLVSQAEEHATNPEAARKLVTQTLREYADTRFDWEPTPIDFDFDAEPPAPDWIVTRAIERGTVVVLSGDTGAAKSIVSSSLLASALADSDWLGLSTNIQRLTVIDEENPARLVQARLRALGAQNDAAESFRYFNREGLAIGDAGRSDAWLRGHLEEFRPDLLIVDTLMAACAVEDTNSNSEAVRVMKLLRSLAREFGCAVLLLHHERKQNKDYPTSSGQAMMGARQWAGQADAHMTLTVESDLIEEEADTEGHTSLRRTFKWRPAEKDRDGRSNRAQRVCVASEKDSSGRLLWMVVENEGEIDEQPSETDALAASLGSLVQRSEADMTTAELASAIGRDSKDGTFKRAITAAVDNGYIEKVKRGVYRFGSLGVLDV
jgi:hypothetical protein